MVVTNSITVGTGSVGPVDVGGDALVVIAGPCGLESEQLAHDVAGGVNELCARLAIPWVFKSSFDKANRTSAGGWRGPGLHDGLAMLRAVRDAFDVPVTTDVHDVSQVDAVAERWTCCRCRPSSAGRPADGVWALANR